MNEQIGKTNKRPLGRITAGALIATLGGVLALSTLMAETPTPAPLPREKCKGWPCTPGQSSADCKALETQVQKVFTDLMDAACKKDDATSKALRDKITNSANGYADARSEVATRLGSLAPFGSEHLVVFYEPEKAVNPDQGIPPTMDDHPNNRCIHIFFLPEATMPGPKTEFNKQLICCYQPW